MSEVAFTWLILNISINKGWLQDTFLSLAGFFLYSMNASLAFPILLAECGWQRHVVEVGSLFFFYYDIFVVRVKSILTVSLAKTLARKTSEMYW